MTSELEIKVREMDDESRTISENARLIADKLNIINKGHLKNILFAKRRGFNSLKEYYIRNFKRRGFNKFMDICNAVAIRKNFKNFRAYKNDICLKLGFLGENEYNSYIRYKKKRCFKNLRDFQERQGLLKNVEYRDSESIPEIESDKDYSLIGILQTADKKDEMGNKIEYIFKRLPENMQSAIKLRFYEGKTLEGAGKSLNLSRERIRQLECMALEKLRLYARQSGLQELYFED